MAPLAAEKLAPVPETSAEGDGIKAVLLGPPGSGKGTQVSYLTVCRGDSCKFNAMFLGTFIKEEILCLSSFNR